MQNLAGTQDTEAARAELIAAGINIVDVPRYGEPQITVEGKLRGWTFRRAWYYWMAKGPAIPVDVARPFNEKRGSVVRVDGFAGGTDVAVPVDSYHIDSQAGLDAFAELLRSTFPTSHDNPDVVFIDDKPKRLQDLRDAGLVHVLGEVLYQVDKLQHPRALTIVDEIKRRTEIAR
jgi:hypothetical protein